MDQPAHIIESHGGQNDYSCLQREGTERPGHLKFLQVVFQDVPIMTCCSLSMKYSRKAIWSQSYFVTVVNYLESSREKQKCVAKVKIFSLNLQETARNKDTLCPLLESRGVYFHSGNIHLWIKPLW